MKIAIGWALLILMCLLSGALARKVEQAGHPRTAFYVRFLPPVFTGWALAMLGVSLLGL